MRKISKQEEVEVSVVIPVYNDPNGIRITLDSLITQSYPVEKYEILVVDNGSTDTTQKIIQEFTDTYDYIRSLVENEIQGSYAARNHGIRHANGSIIAFLDADVSVDHKWLELGVQHLFENVDYLACDVELYSMTEETLVGKFNKLWGFQVERYFNRRHFGPTCGLFVRASVFDDVGLFDERLVSGGDGEFGSRVYQAGKKQRFTTDTVIYHPTRSSLRSLIKKRFRVGQGIYQRKRYYTTRYGEPSISLTDILPMRPWILKERCSDWEGLRNYEKIAFYLISYLLKISQTMGKVREASKEFNNNW